MINKLIVSGIDDATRDYFLIANGITDRLSLVGEDCISDMEGALREGMNSKIICVDAISDTDSIKDILHIRPNTKPPTKEFVEEIISYFDSLIEETRPVHLLVHCYTGISRSTAAALVALYRMYGDEKKALIELLKVRPASYPNKLIIKYADEIMGSKLAELLVKERIWNVK